LARFIDTRSTGKPNGSCAPAAVGGSAFRSRAGAAGLSSRSTEARTPMFEALTVGSTGRPSGVSGELACAGASAIPSGALLACVDGGVESTPPLPPGRATSSEGLAGGVLVTGAVIVTTPALALLTELPTLSIALTPTLYAAPAGSVWPASARSRLQVLPLSVRAGWPCT
jgi:hypothetical protein